MKDSNIPTRHTAPLTSEHIKMTLEEPYLWKLDNGMVVRQIHAGQEEVTRIDFVFNAGSAFQSKRLIALAANRLLREGTLTKTSFQFASLIDYYGAYLETSVTKDTGTVTLYSLNKHLPFLLPLIGEIFSEPAFREEELATYLNKQKQEFLINNAKVKYRASTGFNSLVFGEYSAYGQKLEVDDFERINIQDVVTFFKRFYYPGNGWILVSGNISPELPEMLNTTIGQRFVSEQIKLTDDIVFAAEHPAKGDFFELQPDALQSAIRVGLPAIAKNHPDYHYLKLLNTVLGGYFGSRLMSNLREEKGFTYGVSSYLVNYRHAGFFSVATEVNAMHTEAALGEICHEISRLATEPIGEEELHLVKNYLYGTFLRSFDGPFSLADRFIAANDNDLPFRYYHQSLKTMLLATPSKLMEVANRYLAADNMIRLVVGKKEKV